DPMVYLFVANVISRRLFDLYTERNAEFPRLLLFLEEAHKFLDPAVADLAPTFSRLARETRKFNLILALIDQRPARISDEVRSQLANRFVMSLKEPNDVEAALAGVPDKGMWTNILSKIPLRTVAVMGDAIRIPTVIDVMEYNEENVQDLRGGRRRRRREVLGPAAGRIVAPSAGPARGEPAAALPCCRSDHRMAPEHLHHAVEDLRLRLPEVLLERRAGEAERARQPLGSRPAGRPVVSRLHRRRQHRKLPLRQHPRHVREAKRAPEALRTDIGDGLKVRTSEVLEALEKLLQPLSGRRDNRVDLA